MSATALKLKIVETSVGPPTAAAAAVAPRATALPAAPKLAAKPSLFTRTARWFGAVLSEVLPSLIVVAVLLLIWELVCSGPKASFILRFTIG